MIKQKKISDLSSAHEFALYMPNVDTAIIDNRLHISDKELIRRIILVLRLVINDRLILFNAQYHMRVTIEHIAKNSITCALHTQTSNIILQPKIYLLLPLLKKDDMADAVSMATASGVSAIYCMYTSKSQKLWTTNEQERFERCIIAAAEQSKQFNLPTLYPPAPLPDLLVQHTAKKAPSIFFDPAGTDLFICIQTMRSDLPDSITVIVGPEGDLSKEEKELLHKHYVQFCVLTPTILRSSLAAAVGVGIMRSLLRL